MEITCWCVCARARSRMSLCKQLFVRFVLSKHLYTSAFVKCVHDCISAVTVNFVQVGMKSASHLPKMDTFGSCDPYAVLKLGTKVQCMIHTLLSAVQHDCVCASMHGCVLRECAHACPSELLLEIDCVCVLVCVCLTVCLASSSFAHVCRSSRPRQSRAHMSRFGTRSLNSK